MFSSVWVMHSSHILAIILQSQGWYDWFATFIVMDLRNMMDNVAGSLQAGALQLSETLSGIEALHVCIGMAYLKCILHQF